MFTKGGKGREEEADAFGSYRGGTSLFLWSLMLLGLLKISWTS